MAVGRFLDDRKGSELNPRLNQFLLFTDVIFIYIISHDHNLQQNVAQEPTKVSEFGTTKKKA